GPGGGVRGEWGSEAPRPLPRGPGSLAPSAYGRSPPHRDLPPGTARRHHPRLHVRADRPRLHDGVRRPRVHQLRPLRDLHRGRLRRRRGHARAQERRPPRRPPLAGRAHPGPDRRCDGRRRRRPVRRAVRADQPLQRLHPRTEGVHRGGAGRHREHPGRDGRRAGAGAPGGVRGVLPLAADGRRVRRGVQGHPRVLDADPDPDLPSQGALGRGGEGARMIQSLLAVALTGVSAFAVAVYPRSVLVFLLFQGSILFAYRARIPDWLRWSLLAAALLVLMPAIGYYNGYYLEVATQVGIFVALALRLNIVVGLAGLLGLGYVAFFAVGAYSCAIVG